MNPTLTAQNGKVTGGALPSGASGFDSKGDIQYGSTPSSSNAPVYTSKMGDVTTPTQGGYITHYSNGATNFTPEAGAPSEWNIPRSTVNSKTATDDFTQKTNTFNNLQSSIATQAQTVAQNKATADANAKVEQDRIDAQNAQNAKLAIDKQNADNKALALGGGNSVLGTQTTANPVSPIQNPQSGISGGQISITQDGTTYGSPVHDANGNVVGTVKYDTQTGKPLYETQVAEADQKIQDAYDDYKSQIDSIRNGTMPLSATDQALLDSTKASFDRQIAEQQKANSAYTASLKQIGFRAGRTEYTPEIEAGNIAQAVSMGISKIADLDAKAAQSIATLKSGFDEKNYKLINDEFTTLNKIQTDKRNEIMKLHDDVVANEKDLRNYNLNVAEFNEKVNMDTFDKAYKLEDLALKKRANAIADGLNIPSVPVTADGSPNKTAQANFLATLPPATATALQNLTAYKMNPNDFSSRAGANGTPSQRQQMLTLAHQYDPTYDENQYAARAAYLKNIQSGQMAGAITSANKAINHLTSFANDVSAQGNSEGFSTVNALAISALSPFMPKLQQVHQQATTEATGVKDELAKFFKGSGATDVKSIDDWSKNLDVNATPSQLKGTVQGAITLLAGQLDVMNRQYQNTMGKPAENTILQPETVTKLSKLKDEGYQVDIPNVYYTNKDSWQTYGGGNKEQWDGAVDVLTNNNIPLTQENILHAAQILNQ